MKKLLASLLLLIPTLSYADTSTPDDPHLILVTTGTLDRSRHPGDKLNDNFTWISTSIVTLRSSVLTATTTLTNRVENIAVSTDLTHSTLTWTGSQTFSSTTSFSGNVSGINAQGSTFTTVNATRFIGDGSMLTGIPGASGIPLPLPEGATQYSGYRTTYTYQSPQTFNSTVTFISSMTAFQTITATSGFFGTGQYLYGIEGVLLASTFPATDISTMTASFTPKRNLKIIIFSSGTNLAVTAEPTCLLMRFNADDSVNNKVYNHRNYFNHSSITGVSVSTIVLIQLANTGHSQVRFEVNIAGNSTDTGARKSGYFTGTSITANNPATVPDETHGNLIYNSASVINSVSIYYGRTAAMTSGATIQSGATGQSYILVYGFD